MSSWLPANLFKSAPAQRSWGEEEGRGRVTASGARGAGKGQRGREQAALRPSLLLPRACSRGRGAQGCPGASRAHLSACGSESWHIARPPRGESCLSPRVTRPARRLFGVGIYERYLHLAGSAACLSSNRLLPLPKEMGWGRGDMT